MACDLSGLRLQESPQPRSRLKGALVQVERALALLLEGWNRSDKLLKVPRTPVLADIAPALMAGLGLLCLPVAISNPSLVTSFFWRSRTLL